jgi:hypothetical protein
LLAHHLDVLEEVGLIARAPPAMAAGDTSISYPTLSKGSSRGGVVVRSAAPGKRYEDWELDDPAGFDVAAVRPIRDEIRRRVAALLVSLGIDAEA